MSGVLPLFLFGLVVVGMLVWGVIARNRRMTALQHWALVRHFSYALRGGPQPYARGPFAQTRKAEVTDVLQGTTPGGRKVTLLTYTYNTESSNGSGARTEQAHRHGVAIVHLQVYVPPFVVTRENVLTRAWGAMTGSDLDLESDDFNQTYRVTATDRAAAVAVLHPRAMEYLLAHPQPWWWMENGDTCMAKSGEWRPDELDDAILAVTGFAALLPQIVLTDYGAQGSGRMIG